MYVPLYGKEAFYYNVKMLLHISSDYHYDLIVENVISSRQILRASNDFSFMCKRNRKWYLRARLSQIEQHHVEEQEQLQQSAGHG